MALIDFHCHLDLYPDPQETVREAVSRGVYILSITTTLTAFESIISLAGDARRIQTALGLHPELAVARTGPIRDVAAAYRLRSEVG